MNDEFHGRLTEFVSEYCDIVQSGFDERWRKVRPQIYRREITDTLGGLLARQATLAIEFARSPGIWNGNIAPLILRCMTDAHITLAWILVSPDERSREYIRYGLGQEKLFIEYLEKEERRDLSDIQEERIDEVMEMRKDWLNSQLMDWAIEVNVGSWSGKSTRQMADESGCTSLYRFAYVPFSGAAHNMWQHVGIYNVVPCANPLHKNHHIPRVELGEIDPDYLYRASKYVSRSFRLAEEKLGATSDIPLPVDFMANHSLFTEVSQRG